MWIFIEFIGKASLGTVFFVMLLPIVLLVSCAYYAIKYRSKAALAGGIGMLLLFAVVLGPDLLDAIDEQRRNSQDNLQIKIADKINADHNVFHFSIAFTNCSKEEMTSIRSELIVTNQQGETLLQAEIPNIRLLGPGDTDDFVLEVTVHGDTAEELYYTDYAYLNICVNVDLVDYANVHKNADPGEYIIQSADEAAMKQAYEQAVSTYENGELNTALALFSTLGSYSDSEYYRDLLLKD